MVPVGNNINSPPFRRKTVKRVLNKLALCLALTLSLSACGEKEKKSSTTSSTKPQESQEITPQKCPENSGWTGDKCDKCSGNFWGKNCNKAPTCKNGTTSLGTSGNGECTECTGNFWDRNCDKEPTCVHGTPSLGVKGSGTCSGTECQGNFWGKNCDKEPTCKNGTPNIGVEGTGRCIGQCQGNFAGPNCDSCKDGYKGDNCDESSNCPTGFTGDNCDKCSSGFYGATCTRCTDCGEHGTCNDGKEGDGSCECDANYIGEWCDEKVPDGNTDFSKCTRPGGQYDKSTRAQCTLIDTRDDQKYQVAAIGGQIWLAENMRNFSFNHISANNDASNDKIYGLLYTWDKAKTVCPEGWHLPSHNEFITLRANSNLDIANGPFLNLIAKSPLWANFINEGRDGLGFSSLPAGLYGNNGPFNFTKAAYYWTSSIKEDDDVYYFGNNGSKAGTVLVNDTIDVVLNTTTALSVRCMQDIDCGPNGQYDEEAAVCRCDSEFTGERCEKEIVPITDPNFDNCYKVGENYTQSTVENCSVSSGGAIYPIARIGNQLWMTKNMAITTGNDNSTLTCYENTQEAPDGDPNFKSKYGCLYTFADAQKVCPAGFHLPSKEEFEELLTFVKRNKSVKRDLLTLISVSGWKEYVVDDATETGEYVQLVGTDEFGFTALPAGWVSSINSNADEFGRFGYYWSSSKDERDNSKAYSLSFYPGECDLYLENSWYGSVTYSVRCLLD